MFKYVKRNYTILKFIRIDWMLRGWTLLMECFLRGLKFSDKKVRGLKFLEENFKGSQINFKVWPFFFKISIFLEDKDPNIAKIVRPTAWHWRRANQNARTIMAPLKFKNEIRWGVNHFKIWRTRYISFITGISGLAVRDFWFLTGIYRDFYGAIYPSK